MQSPPAKKKRNEPEKLPVLERVTFRTTSRSAPVLAKIDALVGDHARSRALNYLLAKHGQLLVQEIETGKLNFA